MVLAQKPRDHGKRGGKNFRAVEGGGNYPTKNFLVRQPATFRKGADVGAGAGDELAGIGRARSLEISLDDCDQGRRGPCLGPALIRRCKTARASVQRASNRAITPKNAWTNKKNQKQKKRDSRRSLASKKRKRGGGLSEVKKNIRRTGAKTGRVAGGGGENAGGGGTHTGYVLEAGTGVFLSHWAGQDKKFLRRGGSGPVSVGLGRQTKKKTPGLPVSNPPPLTDGPQKLWGGDS